MPFGPGNSTGAGGGGVPAAHEIQTKFAGWIDFPMTGVGALPGNGAAWQSSMVANPLKKPSCLILISLVPAVAPTAGLIYEVFLIRSDAITRTDNAAATAGAISVQNARMIGALQVSATLGPFTDVFDVAGLGPLTSEFGIILRNSTNQALGVVGSQKFRYNLYGSEIEA